MHTCLAAEITGLPGATSRAEHGEEHPECLRTVGVLSLFSPHHGDREGIVGLWGHELKQ